MDETECEGGNEPFTPGTAIGNPDSAEPAGPLDETSPPQNATRLARSAGLLDRIPGRAHEAARSRNRLMLGARRHRADQPGRLLRLHEAHPVRARLPPERRLPVLQPARPRLLARAHRGRDRRQGHEDLATARATSAASQMELKDTALPIHEDARVRIRPRLFLEGGFYVELDPGSPSAPKIASDTCCRATRPPAPSSCTRSSPSSTRARSASSARSSRSSTRRSTTAAPRASGARSWPSGRCCATPRRSPRPAAATTSTTSRRASRVDVEDHAPRWPARERAARPGHQPRHHHQHAGRARHAGGAHDHRDRRPDQGDARARWTASTPSSRPSAASSPSCGRPCASSPPILDDTAQDAGAAAQARPGRGSCPRCCGCSARPSAACRAWRTASTRCSRSSPRRSSACAATPRRSSTRRSPTAS